MEKQPLLKRRVKHSSGEKASQLKSLLVWLSIWTTVILINNYLSDTAIMILGIIYWFNGKNEESYTHSPNGSSILHSKYRRDWKD
ncbi:hypothetical protein FZW96_20950 [Bacillus sp. BGMRC 2118]|nr:hypothetical protein FZW96_20950 [Bacillus sp. BGMRC 2118]